MQVFDTKRFDMAVAMSRYRVRSAKLIIAASGVCVRDTRAALIAGYHKAFAGALET